MVKGGPSKLFHRVSFCNNQSSSNSVVEGFSIQYNCSTMSNPPTVTSSGSASDAGPANTAATKQEEPAKEAPKVKTEATETTTDADEDKKAATPTTSSDGGEDEDDCKSIKSEGADEEDALFTSLEKNEEEEEAAHPHAQPKDAKAAPMLLQSALAKGDVTMDDSNSGNDVKTEPQEEEKKGEESAESNVVHQRVRIRIRFAYATKNLTPSRIERLHGTKASKSHYFLL